MSKFLDELLSSLELKAEGCTEELSQPLSPHRIGFVNGYLQAVMDCRASIQEHIHRHKGS